MSCRNQGDDEPVKRTRRFCRTFEPDRTTSRSNREKNADGYSPAGYIEMTHPGLILNVEAAAIGPQTLHQERGKQEFLFKFRTQVQQSVFAYDDVVAGHETGLAIPLQKAAQKAGSRIIVTPFQRTAVATKCSPPPVILAWRGSFQRNSTRPIAPGHRKPGSKSRIRKHPLQLGLPMVRSNEREGSFCHFAECAAQAQSPSVPRVSKDDAQKVVTIISGDKAKINSTTTSVPATPSLDRAETFCPGVTL
jgi:hypothetical protein